MPALYCLSQHPALAAVQAQLEPNEFLFGFLDDFYAVVPTHRVRPVLDLLSQHLATHAHVHLHQGKTRFWNAAGRAPPHIQHLPSTWLIDPQLPSHEQGLKVLGVPVGSDAYIQHHLRQTTNAHQQLLQHILDLQDLQASWFLLLYCASPRANYLLRNLPPTATTIFAADHDLSVGATLAELLQAGPVSATALAQAHLPLAQGGLGLLSASAHAPAAYWASWVDTLPSHHYP